MSSSDLVIIGAGPYGLSLSAHLSGLGVPHRIFGKAMESWRAEMPRGMLLKSEGFASNLYDPEGRFPLAAYCHERAIPYAPIGKPVRLDDFVEYGMEFQRRFVPGLESRHVIEVAPVAGGFSVSLADGETVVARNVVVAVGVKPFAYVPLELERLAAGRVSHSSDHSDLADFVGRDVVVVGAGASGADIAALLHQAGASVQLLARRSRIDFHEPPRERGMFDRIREPRSGLGVGWRSWVCEVFPYAFRHLPADFRFRVVARHLGPAPGWFTRGMIEGRVPIIAGATLKGAEEDGDGVRLLVSTAEGERTIAADHVVAATGYQVDLRRVAFLSAELLAGIRQIRHTPVLSGMFETSVPGLHIIGPAAAHSFGPLMRFACGASFVARRLAPMFARRTRRVARRRSGVVVGDRSVAEAH